MKGTVGTVTTYYVGNYFEWTGSTSTMVKYYSAGGTRVAMRVGSSTRYYLLGDHLGGTNVTVTTAGGEYGEVRYKAFGETRFSEGTTPTTFRFTGQREEQSLGIYYYGARWYDSYLNRWIQPDSIIPDQFDPQSWDRFSYVENNPVRYVDPSGHMLSECGQDNQDCNAKQGDEYRDYVYNVLHNEEERRENTERVETAAEILGGAASVVSEPIDWVITAGECISGECSPLALLGLLPIIPGSSIDDIVDLAFKSLTKWNFRENLMLLTGKAADAVKGLEAHHVLPVQFEEQFTELGIKNIHDPRFGAWVDMSGHRGWSYEYNQAWGGFLKSSPSVEQIMDFAQDLAVKYNFTINFP